MEQKLSDTLVKAIDRSNPMMQNLQLASRFNKLVEEGGGADLEDNKEATIDVSAYTDPVEVTPAQGKDGMKKVTVSLSNMPAGANMLYAWQCTDTDGVSTFYVYQSTDVAPADKTEALTVKMATGDISVGGLSIDEVVWNEATYTRISDTEFEVSWEQNETTLTITYTRDATKDVEVWNAPPEVETTKQATIDVSTYDPSNKPVITPTAGKQSMGSVEVTLDNIPSGGAVLYPWKIDGSQKLYLNIDTAPATGDGIKALSYGEDIHVGNLIQDEDVTYEKIMGTEFTLSYSGGEIVNTFTRDVGSESIAVWG